jgi:hypothetical protein
MTLEEIIHNALMAIAPTAPASSSQYFSGAQTTYITYFLYNEQDEAFAANEPVEAGHYWQIDLWREPADTSTTLLSTLKEQVKTALKAIGFRDFTAQALYESDTKINHIAIRCCYVENIQ